MRVCRPHFCADYLPSHRSGPSLPPLPSLITARPVQARRRPVTEPEEAAGAAALRDLQWNWGVAYLITGVGGTGCLRRDDERTLAANGPATARADQRGLQCPPGLPRHRAGCGVMTGWPKTSAHVQAAALRAAFPGYIVTWPGRAAPLRSRGPGRWRPILPDQHRCDGDMARAAARPSVMTMTPPHLLPASDGFPPRLRPLGVAATSSRDPVAW